MRSWIGPAIAVALVVAAAQVFDALTPQVVSVTPFYVGVVLIGFWFRQPKSALALLSTPLIIVGHRISIPDSRLEWEGWINRGLSIFSVWLSAVFVWHIRVLEQKLQRQNDIANSLSRQVTLLASIVEFGNDAIVSTNNDGIITSWNKAAEQLFGYLAEGAIGKPLRSLLRAPLD